MLASVEHDAPQAAACQRLGAGKPAQPPADDGRHGVPGEGAGEGGLMPLTPQLLLLLLLLLQPPPPPPLFYGTNSHVGM